MDAQRSSPSMSIGKVSVPMATVTPASTQRWKECSVIAIFAYLYGQCPMVLPRSASTLTSSPNG
jgi:hypothetical protein